MKNEDSYEFVTWVFKETKNISVEQERLMILEEYKQKLPLISALVSQFKSMIHPIVQKEALNRTNLKELKTTNYDIQKHIINSTDSKSDTTFISNSKELEVLVQAKLQLQQNVSAKDSKIVSSKVAEKTYN